MPRTRAHGFALTSERLGVDIRPATSTAVRWFRGGIGIRWAEWRISIRSRSQPNGYQSRNDPTEQAFVTRQTKTARSIGLCAEQSFPPSPFRQANSSTAETATQAFPEARSTLPFLPFSVSIFGDVPPLTKHKQTVLLHPTYEERKIASVFRSAHRNAWVTSAWRRLASRELPMLSSIRSGVLSITGA